MMDDFRGAPLSGDRARGQGFGRKIGQIPKNFVISGFVLGD
jgi:hypothetical protein